MGFVELEQIGKTIFEQFPSVKRGLKRIYQVISVVTSNEKFRVDGEVSKISPDDEYEYFHGYYDKSPWDATDRYMIVLKVRNAYKEVAPKEPGIVGVIDTENGNKFIEIGTTHSWNVQQGCMAQWLGPDFQSRILYNDFRDNCFCAIVYNFITKEEEQILPMPAYDVSRDGSFALSLDFSRLHRMRPGYGYSNLSDETAKELCPNKGCIWKIDIKTGEVQELFKYTDFAKFETDDSMIGAEHKVNHIMISPSGKRFMVLHRWFHKGRKHTRLVTVNVDRTEMYNLSDDTFVSHCFWKNDEEILSFLNKKESGNHYYLMKDKTKQYELFWPKLNTDGHCSFSPDGQYVITDTYPNRKRIASVYLCTEKDNYYKRIARVFSPFKYDNDCRCDLHPRWNRAGDIVCIDSVHEGKRGLYVVKIKVDLNKRIEEEYSYHKKKKEIDAEYIKRKLRQYEYVSFDIFDTLIKRDVPSPKDVFVLVQRKFEQETGKSVSNFVEIRCRAEKEARINATEPEINIDDIYNRIQVDLTNREKNILKRIEVEVEKKVCCTNKVLKEVYDYCIREGKKIFIISNMYLPQEVIEEILSKAGYNAYQKLYLSSTCKLKKTDGRLFEKVLQEQEILASQIIHIGDSWKQDFFQAKKIGMATIHIGKNQDYLLHHNLYVRERDKFNEACVRAFINNHLDVKRNTYYRFGYEDFGMLLWGFNKWLLENMQKENISDVFFFSRDGHVIKRAFDIQNKNENIRSHYFYVSRRSLRVPQLWMNPEYDQVIEVFPLAKWLTVGTFIKNLGLEPEEYKLQLEKKGLSEQTILKKTELHSNTLMREFYESIKKNVIEHSKKECDIFLDYMEQNGFKGKIAVVDIGWHGSLQYFIQQIADKLDLDLDMYGYYIGLATEAKRQINIQGYVIDKDSKSNSCDMWKAYNGLVENLFLAQVGSTEKFEREADGHVVPVLYPYEYEDKMGHLEWEAVKVKNIQEGAVEFVADMSKNKLSELLQYSSTTAFSYINQTGICPTKLDLALFSDFRFLEEQIDYLAKPRSWFYYMCHPKHLKRDLGFCRWKIGFMKKLFKIPLPYLKMYGLLRKITSEKK